MADTTDRLQKTPSKDLPSHYIWASSCEYLKKQINDILQQEPVPLADRKIENRDGEREKRSNKVYRKPLEDLLVKTKSSVDRLVCSTTPSSVSLSREDDQQTSATAKNVRTQKTATPMTEDFESRLNSILSKDARWDEQFMMKLQNFSYQTTLKNRRYDPLLQIRIMFIVRMMRKRDEQRCRIKQFLLETVYDRRNIAAPCRPPSMFKFAQRPDTATSDSAAHYLANKADSDSKKQLT